ncbi:MAG: GAF domain-containing protein, partial [Janthinobacterium lividum]
PRPADEAQRLALALRTRVRAQASLALLQKIVALAGEVCGTQFASLNIVDEDHVHLMAQLGHDLELTPRDGTPCSWVGTSRDVLVVPALDLDPRFAGGGMVAAGMHRYVGAPVLDVDGRPMAVLCVYDLAPEPETPQQVSALRSLAALAASHLDGADASDVLGRVHGVLQAMPQIDRAEDGCEVISVLTDTAWDLLRPDLLLLVRPATPFAKRWDLLGHRGHIDPDALAHVVFDVDDRSAVSRAVATQRAVWVPDATTSSLLDESLAVRLGAASVLSVPVVTTDGTQFVLSAVWRELQTDLHPALRDAVTALTARTAQYLDAARDEHLHADQPGVGHPRALAAT